MVLAMLAVVLFGTLCGVYAPSLQSQAIDIIAGVQAGSLLRTLLWMLAAYLLYSGSQLVQGLLSARLSQRIVRKLREELFGKLVTLPIRYLDTHSHGDLMSRMCISAGSWPCSAFSPLCSPCWPPGSCPKRSAPFPGSGSSFWGSSTEP